jgi:hypothetical protein
MNGRKANSTENSPHAIASFWKMLNVDFGRSAKVKGTPTGEGNEITRAPGAHYFPTETLVRITRYELLRFANCCSDRGDVENLRNSHIVLMGCQFDATTVCPVIDGICPSAIDRIALETFLRQSGYDLRESHGVVFGSA